MRCKDFLARLRCQEDTDVVSLLAEGVQEEEICLDDVPGLAMGPGNSDEDEDIIIDKIY